MGAFFHWGRTCWESGKVEPWSPWPWMLHGVVRGRLGSPSRDHCTHRQRAMAGVGAVILLNESFTVSPSENWIISFSRRRLRLLLLKNVAGINTVCVPDEVFPSLYSLISFIQEEYLYLLLSLLMHLLWGFLSPKALTLNRNEASGVSSI